MNYTSNKPVPYDTGKVKIGINYRPALRGSADYTPEERQVQRALLGRAPYAGLDYKDHGLYLYCIALAVAFFSLYLYWAGAQ